MNRFFALLLPLLLATACSPKISAPDPIAIGAPDAELVALKTIMTGDFDSSMQASTNEDYYNITLHLQPIWPDRPGHYLYVEQAVAADAGRPYRQRVYELVRKNRKTLVSKVYELPQPERFVGAYDDPDRLSVIGPNDLIEREGCAVYLKKDKGGVYRGATKKTKCKSSLRGASYATSRVSISSSFVQSWDRGFDADGKQVWGATEGGYMFFRK